MSSVGDFLSGSMSMDFSLLQEMDPVTSSLIPPQAPSSLAVAPPSSPPSFDVGPVPEKHTARKRPTVRKGAEASRRYRRRKSSQLQALQDEVETLRAENARLQSRVLRLTDRLLVFESSTSSSTEVSRTDLTESVGVVDAPTPLEVQRERTLSELASLSQRGNESESSMLTLLDAMYELSMKQHMTTVQDVSSLLEPSAQLKLTLLSARGCDATCTGHALVNATSSDSPRLHATKSSRSTSSCHPCVSPSTPVPTTDTEPAVADESTPRRDTSSQGDGRCCCASPSTEPSSATRTTVSDQAVLNWRNWASEVGCDEAQTTHLIGLCQRHRATRTELLQQRRVLLVHLQDFLNSTFGHWRSFELNDEQGSTSISLLNAAHTLTALRKNMLEEPKLLNATLHELRSILSPRQEVLFAIRMLRPDISAMTLLKALWSSQ